MATKLENLELDKAHYKNLQPHLLKYISQLPASTKRCKNHKESILDLLDIGIIQVSTAFEIVMASLTNSTVISDNKHDLANGADCKLTTARHSGYGKSYSAPVGDIAGKDGTLYIQCYERIQNKFYYFAIPKSAYCKIPKSSNIEIPFHLDGTPRRVPGGKRKYANWWDFECKSLTDMSMVCGTTGTRKSTQTNQTAANSKPAWADLFVGLY